MTAFRTSLGLCLSLLTATALTACDTESDDGDADAGGGAACGAIDCSGHGTCTAVDGLPTCDCDEGYTASGLDCISEGATAPSPPEGFTCPAPGAGTEPLFTQLTAERFYYTWNDRTCGTPSSRMLYTFRPDGVFTIQSQFQAAVGSASGNLDYGCYTYAVETRDAGDALRLNYTYSNESNRNCTMLAGLADPPCSGLISAWPEGGFVRTESLEGPSPETHVFWPLTDDACVWCSTAETCCPNNSWTADSNGPVCP